MSKSNKLLAGLIAGGLIGAAAGLLMAPKLGKETRQIVKERADELGRRARDYVEVLREKLRDAGDDETAQNASENGRSDG